MMLGRIVKVPNLDLRHHAEDETYFYTRVQFPHGGPLGRVGEEPWLLTDGDLRAGAAAAREGTVAGACKPGRIWFDTDGAAVEWNLVALEAPRGLLTEAGMVEPSEHLEQGFLGTMGPVRIVIGLTDDRLERIRQRVERNAEDIAANAPRWLADLLD